MDRPPIESEAGQAHVARVREKPKLQVACRPLSGLRIQPGGALVAVVECQANLDLLLRPGAARLPIVHSTHVGTAPEGTPDVRHGGPKTRVNGCD